MRDMALAIVVLVVSLVAVLGAMGLLSVGSQKDNGVAPKVDVIAGLERSGPALKLPIVVPSGLPAGWQGNSFTLADPLSSGGVRTVVRAGWLTEAGRFITLIQSPEPAAALVTNEIGEGLGSAGSLDAGGTTWSQYPGVRDEQAWVRVQDGVTLLITGSAGEADFRTLAESIA